MSMPQAPIPPPPHLSQGPFDGVPMAQVIDDSDQYGNDPMADWDLDVKPKKTKKNIKEDKTPVELKYEGYVLEKATPRPGENWSWARVGQRPMPFQEKKLFETAQRHRQRTGLNSQRQFHELTSNQQGVILRLIEDRQQTEKNKNAEWILYDVQKEVDWKWTSREVKKIQVIIKRVDKNTTKTGELGIRGIKPSYQDDEIIDLAVEPQKKKDKDKDKSSKKTKKSKSLDGLDMLDDPLGLGLDQPPLNNHDYNNHSDHNHHSNHNNHQMQHNDIMPAPPPQPHHASPGAAPMDHMAHNQLPPGFQPPHIMNAGQQFPNMHPFAPNANIPMPQPLDMPPLMDGNEWPHPHHHSEGVRARSRSQGRRPSARHSSMDRQRPSRMEDKLQRLNTKASNRWNDESSDSFHEDDDIFSSPPSESRSFTPPSSPRSHFSESRMRPSLERRKSAQSPNPRYHPRYRSQSRRDVEIEPEYTYRDDGRRYSPGPRRHAGRPTLQHSVTYDDYPREQRYLASRAPTPQPPRALQRRLTEYEDDYDFRDREVGDWRRRSDARALQDVPDYRRRSSRYYEPADEPYEPVRRAALRDRRRHTYAYYR
ncbi:hypothetical protein LTR37_018604 [Vermiconidia calcicola]|uniref:Uncharacterized protein n=1 Tax=Vermiconidia calcicola TaxID=1690605 RepID=A0ACC3MJH6_9PEZI|nr:hypothetical protein LTR37_018604 [Vermiconidia calcicola]